MLCMMDTFTHFKECYFPEINSVYPNCIIDDTKSNIDAVVIRLPLQNKDDAEKFKLHLSSVMNIEWIVYRDSKPSK